MKSAEAGLAIAVATALALMNGAAVANPVTNNTAAHAMAEKFAAEAEKAEAAKRAAEAKRRAFERAQRTVRQRAYRAAVARRTAERKAEDERRRAAQMKADEAEMLARARAEAEAARKAAAKIADDHKSASKAPKPTAPSTPEAASTQEARTPRIETTPAGAVPVAPAAAHEPAAESREALEARRQAESDALAEKLSRFRKRLTVARDRAHQQDDKTEATEPSRNGSPPPPPTARTPSTLPATAEATVSPPRREELRQGESGIDDAPSSRATILLVIEHGRRGIRRFDKTGDPILCLDETCFVGAGPDRPAVRMSRARAFGPGNTFGGRAGACSHSLTCVLRNVDLGGDAVVIQPIDLRVMYHDRRERAEVRGDSDCSLNAGRLSCRFSVKGSDWRAWVVPERLAAKAGPEALEAALDAGL